MFVLRCGKRAYEGFLDKLETLRLERFKSGIKGILKDQWNALNENASIEKAYRGNLVPKQIRATNKKTGKVYITTVYVNPNKLNHKNIKTPIVKTDGENILTRAGKKDFGEITSEISKAIRRQAGKIRLEIGFQNPNDNRAGYGYKHIERAERLKQLKQNGYDNPRDFVEDVTANFDSIYKGKGASLVLCRKNDKNRNIEFIELKQGKNGEQDYWTVATALIAREDYLKNKTPLWVKPISDV